MLRRRTTLTGRDLLLAARTTPARDHIATPARETPREPPIDREGNAPGNRAAFSLGNKQYSS
jgi:hypothetical protein